MNTEPLTMNSLFQQLGLAYTDGAIGEFIHANPLLCPTLQIHESLLWNKAQAEFLRQAIAEDAEWSVLVDQLDAFLRQTRPA